MHQFLPVYNEYKAYIIKLYNCHINREYSDDYLWAGYGNICIIIFMSLVLLKDKKTQLKGQNIFAC